MSRSNVAELDALFAPPATTGVTTQDMQKIAALARLKAKLANDYATIELPKVQAEQQKVDAEINSNPATASDALRAEQEALQADAQKLENVLNGQYLNYTNGVNAWYSNMTSGSSYVPLDKWTETQPASYPDLFAIEAKVSF